MVEIAAGPLATAARALMLAGRWAQAAELLTAATPAGEGEQAVLAITELIRDWKREGRPGSRDGLLQRLAARAGVYVPRFYDVDYLPDGRIRRVAVLVTPERTRPAPGT